MYSWGSRGQQRDVCEMGAIRYKANRNDGHPSFDHDLKRNTSSVDPHQLALKIGFRLGQSTMQPLLELALE